MSHAAAKPAYPAPARPLANRNFRLLWIGENISLFGDHFYGIALPWLIFQMTGSSLAFGTVLMVGGIPRAVLMLVGGVMADRFSPRLVMIVSNLLRLGITVLLTVVVAGQGVQLWMIYVVAFAFGAVDAFFHPAYRAMIPLIVEKRDLQASNAMMLGASQFIEIGGPGIAGVVVQAAGLMLSFAFDAFTFLFTAIMLMLMRPVTSSKPKRDPETQSKRGSIRAEISDMLTFVWHDATMRVLIILIAAVNFLYIGPMVVGTATLSRIRFAEGSAAYGAMLSAFSIGMLLGTLCGGVIRTLRAGAISLVLLIGEGILLIGVGGAPTLIVACALFVLIGFAAGFGNVAVITITQVVVRKDIIGRFMSLVVLAEVGLTPISNALAGAISEINVTALFVGAGILLALTALVALRNPGLRYDERLAPRTGYDSG